MTAYQIELADLIAGLTLFHFGRYHAIRVFADDLSPQAAEATADKWAYSPYGPNAAATNLRFTVHANGIVQLAHADVSLAVDSPLAPFPVAAARSRSLKGIETPAPLAVLISTDGIRAYTMQLIKDPNPLSPSLRGWRAYDGPLLTWAKSQLLPSTPTTNLLVDGRVFQQRPGTPSMSRYERAFSVRSEGVALPVLGTMQLCQALADDQRWHAEVHVDLGRLMDKNDSGALDLSTRDCATPEEAMKVAHQLVSTVGLVIWGAGCV